MLAQRYDKLLAYTSHGSDFNCIKITRLYHCRETVDPLLSPMSELGVGVYMHFDDAK